MVSTESHAFVGLDFPPKKRQYFLIASQPIPALRRSLPNSVGECAHQMTREAKITSPPHHASPVDHDQFLTDIVFYDHPTVLKTRESTIGKKDDVRPCVESDNCCHMTHHNS
jgi:hypothetical protein